MRLQQVAEVQDCSLIMDLVIPQLDLIKSLNG